MIEIQSPRDRETEFRADVNETMAMFRAACDRYANGEYDAGELREALTAWWDNDVDEFLYRHAYSEKQRAEDARLKAESLQEDLDYERSLGLI